MATAGPSSSTTQVAPPPPLLPRFEQEWVKRIADSMGTSNALTPNGTLYIAEQITTLIRRIVYDGQKFAIHGRRAKLKAKDIESAMELLGLSHLKPLGHILPEGQNLIHIPNPNGEDLFVPEDRELELNSLIATPIPPLPVKPHIRAHWLAYNGKVPNIAENVSQGTSEEDPIDLKETEELKSAALAKVSRKETAGGSSNEAGTSFRHSVREIPTKETVQLQQLQVEALSVEQQIYYKDIIEACVGNDDKNSDLRRQDALTSLEIDTGVQALLPRLGAFIFDATRHNISQRCMSMLIYIGRIIRSLVVNKSVSIEPSLHHILPSLLSCMIGKNLCLRPDKDNHWALRDYSAKTLVDILHRKETDQSLRQRIVDVLRKTFMDTSSTYGQIYGTLFVINEVMNINERYEIYNRFVDIMNACHPSAVQSQGDDVKVDAGKVYFQLAFMY
ncbi:taf-6.1 [Pristionchus pacificus]|uniref:Transcription initiation factor TFIID subunit 6 n=1 Tax=Pristionchus pacificus TaxID=54126 RepID=A0A2A6BJH5_PRIPA|nr:taf-6.1 [Pristionchus pacificus]|eukprot:PDM66052.1 taf-6.1 [Pristionchus pacificus]